MEATKLIEQIRAVATPEDLEQVSAVIKAMPGKMEPAVQEALLEKLAEFTANARAAREDIISTLRVNGVEYPLTDWLTPANYARKFDIPNVATVTNWINRGIIPAANIKEIPELGLRLVKAVEYTPRPYSTAVSEDKEAA